jgi:hypothetical protein
MGYGADANLVRGDRYHIRHVLTRGSCNGSVKAHVCSLFWKSPPAALTILGELMTYVSNELLLVLFDGMMCLPPNLTASCSWDVAQRGVGASQIATNRASLVDPNLLLGAVLAPRVLAGLAPVLCPDLAAVAAVAA